MDIRVMLVDLNGRFEGELWLTDGNETGTFMVADFTPGERGSRVDSLPKTAFRAEDGLSCRRLVGMTILRGNHL